MSDQSDVIVFTHRTPDGRGVRHRYEPVDDGFEYIEEVLTDGGTWREVGHERVTELDIETST